MSFTHWRNGKRVQITKSIENRIHISLFPHFSELVVCVHGFFVNELQKHSRAKKEIICYFSCIHFFYAFFIQFIFYCFISTEYFSLCLYLCRRTTHMHISLALRLKWFEMSFILWNCFKLPFPLLFNVFVPSYSLLCMILRLFTTTIHVYYCICLTTKRIFQLFSLNFVEFFVWQYSGVFMQPFNKSQMIIFLCSVRQRKNPHRLEPEYQWQAEKNSLYTILYFWGTQHINSVIVIVLHHWFFNKLIKANSVDKLLTGFCCAFRKTE